jgi:hypothetical protein
MDHTRASVVYASEFLLPEYVQIIIHVLGSFMKEKFQNIFPMPLGSNCIVKEYST